MASLYENCIITALAAIGFAALVWLLASLLLLPRKSSGDAVALLPAADLAPGLEFAVQRLLRCPEAGFSRVIILDLGLQESARQRALLLLGQDPRLRLCRGAEVLDLIENDKEA